VRLCLQVQKINCVRLNINVIMIATCSPWKKSTIPVPDPPFIALAPTLNIAARTIGQHQAPMIAGSAMTTAPIAPKNWHTVMGETGSAGSSEATAGGGPQEPSAQPSSALVVARGSLALGIGTLAAKETAQDHVPKQTQRAKSS